MEAAITPHDPGQELRRLTIAEIEQTIRRAERLRAWLPVGLLAVFALLVWQFGGRADPALLMVDFVLLVAVGVAANRTLGRNERQLRQELRKYESEAGRR